MFDGDDIAFSISANSGYNISDVLVDGESRGIVSTVTIRNVNTDHAVRAVFKSNGASPGGGGGSGG